jgi:hypothetical protein
MINGGIYAAHVEVLNGKNKLVCHSGYLSVLMRISNEVSGEGKGASRRARMWGPSRIDDRR